MAKMTVVILTVRFLTPAFLGDAEQSGRWRTPPGQGATAAVTGSRRY
jgi:hypothetical protein